MTRSHLRAPAENSSSASSLKQETITAAVEPVLLAGCADSLLAALRVSGRNREQWGVKPPQAEALITLKAGSQAIYSGRLFGPLRGPRGGAFVSQCRPLVRTSPGVSVAYAFGQRRRSGHHSNRRDAHEAYRPDDALV
jgi:hypothetical protein